MGPPGAPGLWLLAWQQAPARRTAQIQLALGWLASGDARDLDAARAWIRAQRALVIESALMANATNGPRLHCRAASLAGTSIAEVVVLPVTGHRCLLPAQSTLVVPRATFRDD